MFSSFLSVVSLPLCPFAFPYAKLVTAPSITFQDKRSWLWQEMKQYLLDEQIELEKAPDELLRADQTLSVDWTKVSASSVCFAGPSHSLCSSNSQFWWQSFVLTLPGGAGWFQQNGWSCWLVLPDVVLQATSLPDTQHQAPSCLEHSKHRKHIWVWFQDFQRRRLGHNASLGCCAG